MHLRYFTPIDKDSVRMFTFTLRRETNLIKKWLWKSYYHMWYVYFN